MSDKAWKQFERLVAAFFGGKRNVLSGSNNKNSSTTADIEHTEIYCECKLRSNWSIFGLFRRTEEQAKKEFKIPILALKEKNKHGFLFVIKSSDIDKIIQERDVIK